MIAFLASQSILDPAGPAARSISNLTWFIFAVFLAVTVVMWALLVWAARRSRGTFAEHAPVDSGGGHEWILVGGFAIPAAILAIMFILGLRTMAGFPIHDGEHHPPEIRVIGHQWWWELQYLGQPLQSHFTTANEMHIPVGRPVDVEVQTADVIHSFWVPRLQGKVDLIPGQPNRIRLEASAPGVFSGQCSEYCGEQHSHMKIVVVAQSQAAYDAWRFQALQPAPEPVTDEQKLGQAQFLSNACALCHNIAGTPARGAIGPDLTHVASRRGLAANMLENVDANLEAWVTHAQSFKPGGWMPNITTFSGSELRSVVAYLRTLR